MLEFLLNKSFLAVRRASLASSAGVATDEKISAELIAGLFTSHQTVFPHHLPLWHCSWARVWYEIKLFVFNTSTKGTAKHFDCLYMYLLGGGWCDKLYQPLLSSLWALLWLKAVKIFGLQAIMTFISARIGFQLLKLPEYLDQEDQELLTYIFSELLSLLAITCFSLY